MAVSKFEEVHNSMTAELFGAYANNPKMRVEIASMVMMEAAMELSPAFKDNIEYEHMAHIARAIWRFKETNKKNICEIGNNISFIFNIFMDWVEEGDHSEYFMTPAVNEEQINQSIMIMLSYITDVEQGLLSDVEDAILSYEEDIIEQLDSDLNKEYKSKIEERDIPPAKSWDYPGYTRVTNNAAPKREPPSQAGEKGQVIDGFMWDDTINQWVDTSK